MQTSSHTQRGTVTRDKVMNGVCIGSVGGQHEVKNLAARRVVVVDIAVDGNNSHYRLIAYCRGGSLCACVRTVNSTRTLTHTVPK